MTTSTTTAFLAKLPFEGTYQTWYDLGEVEPDQEMTQEDVDRFFKEHDQKAWFTELSQEYVEYFECGLSDRLKDILDVEIKEKLLTYESCTSPKEYNFSTDKIFVHCNERLLDILILYAIGNHGVFGSYLRDNFTSRSGFIPLYSNKTQEWLDNLMKPDKLDTVELYVLIDFFISYDQSSPNIHFSEEKNQFLEDVYEGIQGNTSLLSIW